MHVALLLSLLALYLLIMGVTRQSGLLTGLSGLLWGSATALFPPLTLLLLISGLCVLFFREKSGSGRYFFRLLLTALGSYGLFLGLVWVLAPQAGITGGWPVALGWSQLKEWQDFVWFDKLLLALFLAMLLEEFRRADLLLEYCAWGLLLLGLSSLFVLEANPNLLLFGLPLIVMPVAGWWPSTALQQKNSLALISVLIIVNLCLPYVDLF